MTDEPVEVDEFPSIDGQGEESRLQPAAGRPPEGERSGDVLPGSEADPADQGGSAPEAATPEPPD